MSADPLPITAPLIAAFVGALHAGAFACVDAALTSVSSARLEALAREEAPRFQPALERASQHRERVQARYVTGRLLGTAVAASGFTWWLRDLPDALVVKLGFASVAALLLAVLVYAATLFGRHAADWVITFGLYILRPFELAMVPVSELLRNLVSFFPSLRRRADPRVNESEVELMVDQQEKSGALDEERGEMIRNVLEFSELTARDAMVPRTKVTAIKLGTPLDDVLRTIVETGHSRYPVYREDIDDVVGLLYAKDLFRIAKSSWFPPAVEADSDGDTPSRRGAQLLDVIREPIKIVSESQPLSSLLREMRQDRHHLAVVVDEFGGFTGIVTLEDILEEIVGDIQDESDSEEAPIVEVAPGRLLADAAVCLSDLSAYLGSELDPDGQYDSLGGMLTDKVGSVPEVGTSIPAFGMRFIVRESDAKHIAKVEIVRAQLADASGSHSVAS